MNNLLPNNPIKLERLIGATEPLDLGVFAEFVDFAADEKPTWQDRLADRRVPDSLRASVLVRDGGRCRKCRRWIDLEINHIIPVSKEGEAEMAFAGNMPGAGTEPGSRSGSPGSDYERARRPPRSIAVEMALLFLERT